MRHHARAVILLGGWLLMLPPTKGEDVNTHAPLSRWEHRESYDTAAECTDDRNSKWTSAEKRRGEHDVITLQYLEGRCVPAEAVYPPKVPAQK